MARFSELRTAFVWQMTAPPRWMTAIASSTKALLGHAFEAAHGVQDLVRAQVERRLDQRVAGRLPHDLGQVAR
jgi:hypothetical protein